jgi:ABC-type transporter Mla subunit MlaD
MSGMADKSAGDRPARQRIKTLTQAAMNADVTVNQLEDILAGLGDTLNDLNSSLSNLNGAVDRLDAGLDHFEATLSRIDDLMKRLVTLVAPVEAIVERIDYMVGIGETVMSPLSVTEHAFRNVVNVVRNRTARQPAAER